MRKLESLMLATVLTSASCATIPNQRVQPVEAQRNISSREVAYVQIEAAVDEYLQKVCERLNVVCKFKDKPSIFKPGDSSYGDPYDLIHNHPEEYPGNVTLIPKNVKWWFGAQVMVSNPENPSKKSRAFVMAALDNQGRLVGFHSSVEYSSKFVR